MRLLLVGVVVLVVFLVLRYAETPLGLLADIASVLAGSAFVLKLLKPFLTPLKHQVGSVVSLLRLRGRLEPVRQSVTAVPQLHQQDHVAGLAIISDAWAGVLTRSSGGNSKEDQLLSAFFGQYAQEEARDVGGKAVEDKHFVVTNFVAYSKLVRAVIRRAQVCFGEENVTCRTALALPLTKWFNYREIAGRRLRYCASHADWDDYLGFQHRLVQVDHIQVQRVVLAVPNDSAYVSGSGLGFHKAGCMRRHARSWILVPVMSRAGTTTPDWERLRPWDKEALDGLRQVARLGNRIKEAYPDNVLLAYVILPDSAEPLPEVPGFEWVPVWRAFLLSHHRTTEDSRYRQLTSEEVENLFVMQPPDRAMPEDVFLVGMREHAGDKPAWVFGLAADVDPNMNRITLEFMTPALSTHRFNAVQDYLESVWTSGVSLSSAFG